jgi:hypothetical protein
MIEPKAYMRKWAADGVIPAKEKKPSGHMAWPKRFKLLPVTAGRCLDDDVPLYAEPPPDQTVLLAALRALRITVYNVVPDRDIAPIIERLDAVSALVKGEE